MASFSIDQLGVYESLVDNGLTSLATIMINYEEGISTSRNSISTLDFNNWQDIVQVAVKNRVDEFNNELKNIESSISSEHLPYLKKQLELLKETLTELKSVNNKYISSKNSLKSEEKKAADGEANAHIITHFETECTTYNNQRNGLVSNVNKIIQRISEIDFLVPIQTDSAPSSDTDSTTTSSKKSTEKQNSDGKITRYYDTETKCIVEVTMTTKEENGKIVQKRTTTYTDKDGNVKLTETFTITQDKKDPRQVKVVDEDGNVYETRVNEKGQVVNVTKGTDKNGKTITETTPIGESYYTMTLYNEKTHKTETYTINKNSPADMAIYCMLYENAAMKEGLEKTDARIGAAFLWNVNERGAVEIGYSNMLMDITGVTITFTPKK